MNTTTILMQPIFGVEPEHLLMDTTATSAASSIPRFLSTTAWGLDKYADFEMPFDMLEESWPTVFSLVALYVGMVFAIKPLKNHSKINQFLPALIDLQTARFAWNCGLALYSIIGSLHMMTYLIQQIFDHGVYEVVTNPDDSFYQGPVGFWFLLFILGKIVELGDTVFLILSGRKVIFLHWFHHATVLPCSWYALQAKIPMMPSCSAINYAIHAVMYSYFALNDTTQGGENNPTFRMVWAKRITTMQCTQFVLHLTAIFTGGYDRLVHDNPNIPPISVLLSASIIGSYLYLFLQFAEEKYAYRSQVKQSALRLLYQIHRMAGISHTTDDDDEPKQVLPWNRTDRTLAQRFQEATKMAAMLYGAATEQDLVDMYGCYKQVKDGPMPKDLSEPDSEKDAIKYRAWKAVQELTTEQAQEKYIAIMNVLSERSKESEEATKQQRHKNKTTHQASATSTAANSLLQYPVRIAGHGKYLPQRVVYNHDIEEMGGLELSSQERKRTGVHERRFVDIDGGENLVQNGAKAVRAACAKAGIDIEDLDLIVGGFGGHQFLPDDACLVQRELGLGESGIRSFTVHATCLSFMVGMEVAASLMRDGGKYRNVAVFASSIASVGIYKKDAHTAGLFGDGAAAVILQPSTDLGTGIHGVHMETYGCGADACQIEGGGTYRPPHHPKYEERQGYFAMNGQKTLTLVSKYARGGLHNFIPGLERGLDNLQLPGTDQKVNVDWVVPHQASAVALDSLAMFGWPEERILKTLHKYGNCIAASIPLTLCEHIDNGTIKRGDRLLICGTSAGLSVGSMLLTY